MRSGADGRATESVATAGPAAPDRDETRVSLVIPAFRAATFLDAALASAAAQTRPFDEVVVVDDASPDDGADVALRWRHCLPLRLVRKPVNEGLGAARRTGIEHSTGELVALLDADDVLLPDHLETMLGTYRSCGGVVTADALWWAPGKQLSLVSGRERRRVPVRAKQRLGILEHNFVHPTTLFSREDYERAGGFNDLRRMEDWDLWLRMVRQGVPVTMAGSPTVLYRIHAGSLTANRREQLTTNVVRLSEHLDELGPAERRVLERTIRRRRARMDLLAGEESAAQGRMIEAFRLWVSALRSDRSFRGGLIGARGSVSLHALINLLTLGQVGRIRTGRVGMAGAGVRCR